MSATPCPRERGSALVLAMMSLAVLAVVTHAVTVGARTSADATLLERGHTELLQAADGAVALARQRLATDEHWSGDRVTIGRCDVEVTVARGATGDHELRVAVACPVRGAGLPVRGRIDVVLARGRARLPTVVGWHESLR